jgi:uncharacterized protein (DUF2147 family)
MIVFLLLLAAGSVCFAIDPAEGYWLSVDEKTNKVTAGWTIYQEGGKLCGKVLSTADEKPGVLATRCQDSYAGFPVAGKVSQMPVVGTPWIFGLSPGKTGEWAGGSVINPEDGKIYKCKIIFHPADGKKYKADTLEMRGEIGLGIGRSQFWQKTDRETAGNLWPK